MASLTEIMQKMRTGELPRSNAVLNEGIADYIAAQKGRRIDRRRQSDADFAAQPGMAQEIANVLGLQTPEQQQSEGIGKLVGATNPAIRRAPSSGFQVNLPTGGQGGSVSRVPSFENISTQPPQGTPTLADFVRNPQLGVQAQASIEDERKRTQEIIKSNLITERQMRVAQFKEGFKGKTPKSVTDMTPNQIFSMVNAYAKAQGLDSLDTSNPQMVQEAFKFFFAGDVPVKDTMKGAGLSEEAQEVLKKRKK